MDRCVESGIGESNSNYGLVSCVQFHTKAHGKVRNLFLHSLLHLLKSTVNWVLSTYVTTSPEKGQNPIKNQSGDGWAQSDCLDLDTPTNATAAVRSATALFEGLVIVNR